MQTQQNSSVKWADAVSSEFEMLGKDDRLTSTLLASHVVTATILFDGRVAFGTLLRVRHQPV